MCMGATPACSATNQCVECTAPAQCTSNPNGKACLGTNVCGCTAMNQATDCPAATPKCDGTGKCVECVMSGDCTNGKVCDGNNTCVQCTSDTQCMGLTSTPHCATVAPNIGTCVQCDLPDNSNSPHCSAPNGKCNNMHQCF
jgi:hypothetical protein